MNSWRIVIAILAGGLLPQFADAAPWRGVAEGRGALPSVEVEVGYPSGYVSTVSSPIVLRIRTAERGFDGHIGFHIAVGRRRTIDMPVLMRATIAPHSEHVFSTWVRTVTFGTAQETIQVANRELVVDWCNASMDLLHSRSVGVPPWQPPLPLVLPSSPLSAQAQWYAGFASVITPLDHWFELPMAVREAIFRSATHVVFYGAPKRIPEITPIDRVLLPIELRAQPMTLEVPWPYRTGDKTTMTVPISWVARPRTRTLGSPQSPYIVTNGIATFFAGDGAVRGVPSFRTTFYRNHQLPDRVDRSPSARDILREMRPFIMAVLLIPLPVIAWFAMRRRPRILTVAVMGSIALILIFVRDSVRASSGRTDATVLRIQGPNVFDRITAARDFGPTPIGAMNAGDPNAVAWATNNLGATEVRTSRTPPGFGTMVSDRAWDSSVRMLKRRELGTPATIRARQASKHELTIEYQTRLPVDYVVASWMCGEKRCWGSTAADANTGGTITVRNGVESWSCLQCRFEGVDAFFDPYMTGSTFVTLISLRGKEVTAVSQVDPPQHGAPYLVSTSLTRDGNVLSGAFVLPPGGTTGLRAEVTIRGFGASSERITLAGSGGSVTVAGNAQFFIPFGALERIAPAGGIVTITVEASPRAMNSERWEARLRVEKRQP